MTNASELLEGTTRFSPDLPSDVLFDLLINGQADAEAQKDAAEWLISLHAEHFGDFKARQVTQLETQLAEVREALGKVQSYHKGEKPYDFHRLPDDQRQNEAFDAWQVIACEIDALLTKEPK